MRVRRSCGMSGGVLVGYDGGVVEGHEGGVVVWYEWWGGGETL